MRVMHGLVGYGAHTVTHSNLAKLDRDQATKKIFTSKMQIEDKISCKVKFFAYPFGSRLHFTDETIKILQKARFDAALTTIRGTCSAGGKLFILRRIGLDNTVKGYVLSTLLSGLWILLTT